MITTPSTDFGLDEKHAKQLEVGLQKLSNVEAEVAIANRNLRVLKDDVVKATLELKELEEKVVVLTESVEAKKKEKTELEAAVADMKAYLEKTKSAIEALGAERLKKDIELADRESAIIEAEETIARAQEKNVNEAFSLEKERKEVESVKEAFNAVTLPWK